MLVSSIRPLHPMSILAVMQRTIVIFFFSVHFFDILIYKNPIIFEAKLSIIANWWLNYSFTLVFFFGGMKSAKIITFQYLLSCWPFFWIK